MLKLDQAIRGRPLSSKASQIILTAEEENRHVLSVQDFVEFYGITPSYARKMIAELAHNGWLMRVGKGQYQLLPAKTGLDPYPCGDKFLVACQRFPDSFIAFGSAAEYHGLTQQIFPTVLLSSARYSGERSIGNTSVILFKIPAPNIVGYEQISRGPNFKVSTVERTLIDCIDRPDLCGGISDLPEILHRAKNRVEVERILDYLPTYNSKSLICKVACLLERAGYRFSADQEERLQEQSAGVKTYLFRPGRAATSRVIEYSKKWRVLINADGFESQKNASWHQMRLNEAEKKKMQENYQKTLDKLTKFYLTSDQFNGLRGDRLALEAEMDSTMARIIFRDLCNEGLIDIVSSRAFVNPHIKADRTIPKDVQLEDIERELTTFCVYPSPKHLAIAVKKNRFPHFKMELAKGCGQLDIRYFDNKVLGHYIAHPDKYLVLENPFRMGQCHTAFKDVPRRQWNKVWGAVKCPGVRQLADGGRAICMTLRYLSQMPGDEQLHWAKFELPSEQHLFLPDSVDDEFTKWYYGLVRSKPAWEGGSCEENEDDD